jgi:DHA3 family macrolide efflux protein-like MFS transporter
VRKFFIVWTGQAFSLFGSALVQFALLPQVLAGPFIGVLVDRWDRKRIMITADIAIALVTAGLVALFVVGAVQPWHICLAALARGVGQTFHLPAMQAATSLLVPVEAACFAPQPRHRLSCPRSRAAGDGERSGVYRALLMSNFWLY